jgi:hypothetical protein
VSVPPPHETTSRVVVGMDMAPPISGEHITSGSAKELVATVAGVQDV